MRGFIFGIVALCVSGLALAQQDPSSSAPAVNDATQADWKRQAEWKRVPDFPSMMRIYPARARKLNVTGRAVMDCVVTRKGRLKGCKKISEDPSGFGFGDAELYLAPYFEMVPATVGGKPVESEITVPMRFDLK